MLVFDPIAIALNTHNDTGRRCRPGPVLVSNLNKATTLLTTSSPESALLGPRLIVALDFDSREACMALVGQLDPAICRLKVGKEMFTLFGPHIIEELHQLGFDIFLDLKFHDIPNTVAKAVKAAAKLGVWMVNVHTSGGPDMLEAARAAADESEKKPLLIGVTVLTSMNQQQLEQVGVAGSLEGQVDRLAKLAHSTGLDGVVCSAHEAASIKKLAGPAFSTVTPGIRPSGASLDDQHRVLTPAQAIRAGSDYLVVGRPITQSPSPLQVSEQIHRDIKAQLGLL